MTVIKLKVPNHEHTGCHIIKGQLAFFHRMVALANHKDPVFGVKDQVMSNKVLNYVIVILWVDCLYMEIIHKL